MVSPIEPTVPTSLTCAKAFGRVLAQFHEAASDFEAPEGSEWTRVHPLTLMGTDTSWIERLYSHSRAERKLLVDWRARAVGVISAAGQWTELGMCHGEAYPATCRVADDGLAIAELDWAGEGSRTYDLATFLWTLVLHANDQAEELFSQFLDEYAEVRKLPNLAGVRSYVAARHLWSLRLAAGFVDQEGLSRRAEFASTWSLLEAG